MIETDALKGGQPDPTARLSRWRDALQRMRAEGLDLAP